MITNFAILNELVEKLKTDIKASLEKQKHVASGKLLDSIDVKIQEAASELNIIGYQEDYGKYVDAGRKPRVKGVPVEVLEEWIKVINIASESKEVRSIAFAIQNSIKEKGIPAKPYSKWKEGNSIKRIDYLDEILNEKYIEQYIEKAFYSGVQSRITSLTQQYSKL